jgi:SAM-dependent methyltransferase
MSLTLSYPSLVKRPRRDDAPLFDRQPTDLDLRYGIQTDGHNHPPSVYHRFKHSDGYRYEPIRIQWFTKAIQALPIQPRDYSFIDLGCGKGRALILAREMGFGSIVGVELIPRLAAFARRNAIRAGGAIEVKTQDAARFADYPSHLVLYLFNPFGHKTMQNVIDNLVASKARDVWVVYLCGSHCCLLREAGFACVDGNAWRRE